MLEIRLSKTNQDFLDDLQDVLLARPECTQLLLVNVTPPLDAPLTRNEFRGGVFDGEQLLLVFLNPALYNLQLYSTSFYPEAIDKVIEHLIVNLIEFKGIQGTKENTEYFIKKYEGLTSIHFRNRLSMDIMRLDQLIQPRLVGDFTIATMDDILGITDFEVAFYDEAVHQLVTHEVLREKVVKQISNNQLFVLKNKIKNIVSIGMASRKMGKGRAISLVYTPPQFRNMGYSSSLMYQLCNYLLEEGYEFITLFVDKTNQISNHVYSKIGFYISEDNYDYVITEESWTSH